MKLDSQPKQKIENSNVKNNILYPHHAGLVNVGQSCYMNATIECLSNIKSLSNHLIENYGNYNLEDPIYYVSHHCDYVDYDGPRGKNILKLIAQWYEYCDSLEYNDQYEIDKEINYHKDVYIKLLARKIVENSRRYKDAK